MHSTLSDKNKSFHEKSDHSALIKNIRKGDAYAFRTLFKMYYKPLVRYAQRYVRTTEAAEDIVGDIFLKIWEKRARLDIKTSVKAYLFKMAHNGALNYLKSKRMEPADLFYLNLSLQSNLLTDETIHADELKKHIEQAITELPNRTRDVFTMHRYDNLKYSEIAEILNIKEGTVETHMVRALKYLRKRLAFLLSVIPIFL
ncbi:MAG TPA: RNA polymerase sigma-70 factor [Caldithrix abyssi]|uniref:RNA polymerase sigma-70 factor n=1 Tax=Caldithrix abyssi TaxID=187145 RepID=A0A7V4U3F8_CALAY|nr:RNA polymerase sigma-70 factor [Caldithrix abyssi]